VFLLVAEAEGIRLTGESRRGGLPVRRPKTRAGARLRLTGGGEGAYCRGNKALRAARGARSGTMAEITIDKLPRKLRETFEKANLAVERGSPEYAFGMYKQILAVEPRFLAARKNLRVAQLKVAMAKKPTQMTHQMSSLKGMFTLMGGQGKLNKDPKGALAAAEKLMELDPLNFQFLKFYSDAAQAAEMTEAAVQTLELARPYFAKNVDFLRMLASLYLETKNPAGAKDCYGAVVKLRPTDQQAIKDLKDAAALDTMKVGNWEDTKSDYRAKLKDQKLAKQLEQQNRSVQGETDVADLIKARLADVQREPQNMNFRRALADLYLRGGQFDEALKALDDAEKAAGRADPQIEKMKSSIKVKRYDAAIAAEKDPAKAEAIKQERAAFIFDDAVEMARRYPNDLQCRYDLGVQYFGRERYMDAIEEFQLAQRNPQRRIQALYHLALCFSRMGQADIAFEQLKKAESELTLMDENKKAITYELGLLSEQMGRKDEAAAYYKAIYAVDIKYRDVAQKIASVYQKQA
jgi:tetratricopeptide (TPR) repeat protein